MAIELRNLIQSEFGVSVRVLDTLRNSTLETLTRLIREADADPIEVSR